MGRETPTSLESTLGPSSPCSLAADSPLPCFIFATAARPRTGGHFWELGQHLKKTVDVREVGNCKRVAVYKEDNEDLPTLVPRAGFGCYRLFQTPRTNHNRSHIWCIPNWEAQSSSGF